MKKDFACPCPYCLTDEGTWHRGHIDLSLIQAYEDGLLNPPDGALLPGSWFYLYPETNGVRWAMVRP